MKKKITRKGRYSKRQLRAKNITFIIKTVFALAIWSVAFGAVLLNFSTYYL